MDKSLIIIFYIVTFIIILSMFSKKDNLDDNLTFKIENSVNDNVNVINYDLKHYKKLEDRRHAMLLEQIKRLSITNSSLLGRPSTTTVTNVVNGTGGSAVEVTLNEAGQTFRRLLTEQPHRFNKGTVSNFSTRLELNWNFDRILPKYDEMNVVSKLNFLGLDSNGTNYGNTLPYIKFIKVQLLNGSSWENIPAALITPDVTPTLTYSDTDGIIVGGKIDTLESKNLTIKRSGVGLPSGTTGDLTQSGYDLLNSTNPLKIRIFGVNNAPDEAPPLLNDLNTTQDDNRIIIYNSNFLIGKPASPAITQSATTSGDIISLILKVDQTEIEDDNSPARISQLTIKYNEAKSFGHNVSINNTDQFYTIDIENGNIFNADLPRLKPGMSYITNFSTLNTLEQTSSFTDSTTPLEDTSTNIDLITDPPITRDPINIEVSLATTADKNVVSPNFSARYVKYYPTTTSAFISYNDSGNQVFEVSNPQDRPSVSYIGTNPLGFLGIGSSISDVNNLVSIRQSIDNNVRQSVTYNGFTSFINSGTGSINSISHEDSYIGNANSVGFRIKGECRLSNFNLLSESPSANLRKFTTEFVRNTSFSPVDSNTDSSLDFVIDNLVGDPTLSGTGVTQTVNEDILTMSIPSVRSIDLTASTRSYGNINTSNLFMNGNLIIGNFSYTDGNLNEFGINTNVTNFSITANQITGSGNYSASNIYNLSQKTVGNIGTNPLIQSTLNYTDTAFNLNGQTSINGSLTFKIHCDRSSYNSDFTRRFPSDIFFPNTSNGTNLFSQLQTDPTNKMFEYNDHTVIPNSFAMLFYKNTFNVDTSNYPDQVDKSFFNGLSNNYTSGTNGMSLSLPTNVNAAQSLQGTLGNYKIVLLEINSLLTECTSLTNTGVGGVIKSVSLEEFLENKKIDTSIIQECRSPYGNSFALVFAKFGSNWAIGSPSITYSSFTSAWWTRQYIQGSGDTNLLNFYSNEDINGCKHQSLDKVSLVYEDSSTSIDLNSPIYVLIASKI